jgi:quercetin dioxygenase-like cupin family protein
MMTVQGLETLHRSTEDLPWVPFTPYSEDFKVKLLKVDPATGQIIALLSAPAGTSLGVHNHFGTVLVYTVRGAWRYAEHNWVSRTGDFVYETAGSQHTFFTEPGDDLLAFVVVEGALQFLDPEGKTIGIENWKTFLDRYYKYCEKKGLRTVDLMKL